MEAIIVQGAHEHNLQNISLTIPRNKLVCFVGVSGSGKSTMVFDIIAKEGQRQYFESLNTFARRYLQKSNRPAIESIQGVSATIVIGQDRIRNNPRSTVGTISECYTYLRLLYSRVGLPTMDSSYFSFNHPKGACSTCKGLGRVIDVDPNKIVDWNKSLNEGAMLHSEWKLGSRYWNIVRSTKYFDMDKKLRDFTQKEKEKLFYSPSELFQDADGFGANRWSYEGMVTRLKRRNSGVHRSTSERDMKYYSEQPCTMCYGKRLQQKSLAVLVNGKNIGEVAEMPLTECLTFIESVDHPHATVIKPRLMSSLQNLIQVGVGYLSLHRSAETLSGGEAQRVRFSRQLGCDLIETIYIFDEPTAGLHAKDIDALLQSLYALRDKGNTVLVVEHNEQVITHADHIIEFGPGGGKVGGTITAEGNLQEILNISQSITAPYLLKETPFIKKKRRISREYLHISNACTNNLQHISTDIPLGLLVVLTGVSGSGKSSFVEEMVRQYRQKLVLIDQTQIGQNKRGCLATYMGIFDHIRKFFAKEHNLSPSLFSFNAQGACQSCQGIGYIQMDMNFLGDVRIHCESCNGSRYKNEMLAYRYHEKSIADVLNMTASEAWSFLPLPEIRRAVDTLRDVGLDYLCLGQTLDTLSGGESQRLKLASRLQSKGELYILDEPTSGLHFADVEKLLRLLQTLVDNGNSVIMIEHDLSMIWAADWIIDFGPGGGVYGGRIIAQGTPEDIMNCEQSYTGQYLKSMCATNAVRNKFALH